MSATTYSVVRVAAADLPTMGKNLYASNVSQPTNRFLYVDWPNEAYQISRYTDSMKDTFQNPSTEMFKVVDDVSGDILGSLLLTRKSKVVDADELPTPNAQLLSTPPEINPQFMALMRQTLKGVQEKMSEIDHYELSSIYVTPSSQKRGIGTHLVQLCKEKAASAGLPLFVCALPTARAFYQKVGFIENTYVSVDLSKWAPEYCGYGEFRFYGMLMGP